VISTPAPHIFQDHLLQPLHAGALAKPGYEQIWPSVFLIVCLALLVLVKARFFSKVVKIVQSTFSLRALQELEREELNPFRLYSILLNLFFILNLSFLAYKLNGMYHFILVDKPDLAQFFFFLGLIILLSGIKAIANRILGYFTNEKKVISEYVVNSLFINQTFGLLIFPWMVLIQLSNLNPLLLISCSLIVVGLSVLLKWYRGMIIGLVEQRIGILQIFSYFCSLEILPIFIVAKYIIETF
jgi:hypothetical protein